MYKNLAATLVAACLFSPFHLLASDAPKAKGSVHQPIKAAFVYVTPVFDMGWTHQHDKGRQAVEKTFGADVKTTVVGRRC
jgi:simple sugar transport system substrate-binding protein